MKFKEFISEAMIRKLDNVVYDFHWDEKRQGFYTTVGDKEIEFFKANGPFDRSGAQEKAQKLMIKLYSDAVMKKRKEDDYKYQYEKPLSKLEQEFVELDKKMIKMKMTDQELKRWEQLAHSGIIRRSVTDRSHQAYK